MYSTRLCHKSPEESRELIQRSAPTPDKPWNRTYAIMLRGPSLEEELDELSKPQMIGVVGTPREAEIAYRLHPDYWGKGYMSEAVSLFLQLFWTSQGRRFLCMLGIYLLMRERSTKIMIT